MMQFSNLGSIHRPSKLSIYIELDDNIDFTCKLLHLFAVKFTYFGVILPQSFITAVNYFIYDLKDDSYHLPFQVVYVFCVTALTMNTLKWNRLEKLTLLHIHSRLPFDWHTPFGYFIALFAQFTAAYAMLSGTSIFISFLFGSCWLFITIIRDITNDLMEFNCKQTSKSSEQNLKVQFHSIVELYVDGKQLMDEFNGIYEIIITTGFFWARLGIEPKKLNFSNDTFLMVRFILSLAICSSVLLLQIQLVWICLVCVCESNSSKTTNFNCFFSVSLNVFQIWAKCHWQ